MNRKLLIYIAASLDGYIAKPNDDLGFLSMVEKEGEDYGYKDFIQTVDTVILGRKTYDWVKKHAEEFSHKEKQVFVMTRTAKPAVGNTQFYTGDLKMLVEKLKSEEGKNIFCDGGAEIVNELLKEDLIDELTISFIPILLGHGIRLFKEGIPEQPLQLVACKSFETGLVQVHYRKTIH